MTLRADARGRLVAVLIAAGLLAGCTDADEAPAPQDALGGSAAPVETDTPAPVEDDPPASRTPPPLPTGPLVTEPDTPVPETRAALTSHLEQVLADARRVAPELVLTALVVDEAGREVVSLDPDRPVLPASTLKQVTAAAALTTFGPDGRLRTTVEATGGVDESGTLAGDLIVVGVGDPTLVTEEYARFVYPARPRTSLDALADELVTLGLQRVDGQVRGAAPAFAPPSLPSGWRDDYLDTLDGRYVAGLTVDGGLVTEIQLPELPEDEEEAEGEAGDEGEEDGGATEEEEPVEPGPPVNILDQLAALDTDLPPTVRTRLAPDPVLHVASELTRMLEERGVEVVGEPTTEPAPRPVAARLAAIESPPMEDVLRFLVQRSDNHLADALAVVTARARTRDGSWAAVPRAFSQVLERFGAPTAGTTFADGSGLSRDDRVTARTLTELDRRLTGSQRFGGSWRSLQAVAGVSGTLDGRLRGTAAEGRLLGKTGTLRDVAALSGQIIGVDVDPDRPAARDERRYHLTVVGNDADGVGRGVTRAVVDEFALALVADLDGCRLEPLADDGPLGRPGSTVRCGSA